MATGPGTVSPSADDPLRKGTSLAGRHQPPPLRRRAGALPTRWPLRQRLGRPADSVTCSVFDRQSVKSANLSFWVFEMAPLVRSALATRPAETRRGSTP